MQLSKMLVASSTWHSTLCVLTWKPKATPHNRLLFQLAVSKHPIVETESGSSEKMWRTPTAEGDGGKRGLGKMTVKEAKQKNRQVSLSREIREEPIRKMPPNKKNLWSTPTAFDAHNIKGKRKNNPSGGQVEPLQQQVRMWPTPRARDYKDGSSVPPSRVKKLGTATLGQKVVMEEIKMWPTPRVSDTEGGVVKNVELNNGNFSRTNKKGVRWGVKLKDAVSHVEKQKNMFPTPSSRDWKGGHGTIVNEDGKYYRVSNTTGTKWGARLDAQIEKMDSEKQETLQTTGSLNPDWVEWLMGYGQGYTDPDNKDKFTLDSHQGFPNEPEIARVTTENQYRKDRLKALGNSIVPQIAYHIGLAILEQERH